MPKGERATLKDIINYEPEKYISDSDVQWVKSVFKSNPRGLEILRKIFLPSVDYLALPIEEFAKDMWFSGLNWSQIPNEEAKAIILARQDAIKIVAGGLIQLQVIANAADEKSPADIQKDSTE